MANGTLTGLSIGLVVLSGSCVFVACMWGLLTPTKAIEGSSKAAFVVAGYIVSAFNLRFRIIDTVQKDFVNYAQAKRLKEIYSKCRTRLDRWIIFFVFTATMCAISIIIPFGKLETTAAVAIWSLFITSGIGFLWILRSFRDLEDGILERIEKVKAEQAFAQIEKDSKAATAS
jgi:hypothetical protein